MTYSSILAIFILPPLLLFAVAVIVHTLRSPRTTRHPWIPVLAVGLHMLIALLYTTPWDNYLVATGVWWYDPQLVAGYTLGWVPVEEYFFFLLQTALTGFWLLLLRFRTLEPNVTSKPSLRKWVSVIVFLFWVFTLTLLFVGLQSTTYLVLILVWALPPILLQLAFGADILIPHWRLIILGILSPTLYLWLVDALAIRWSTWTIDPVQTTGLKLGPLPMEEMLFFLVTNILVVFGVTLFLSPHSLQRGREWLANSRLRLVGTKEAAQRW